MSNMTKVVHGQLTDWSLVNWEQVRKTVKNLRPGIFQAQQSGRFKQLRRLEKLLAKSRSHLLLSVRQITQVNTVKPTRNRSRSNKHTLEPQWKTEFSIGVLGTASETNLVGNAKNTTHKRGIHTQNQQ